MPVKSRYHTLIMHHTLWFIGICTMSFAGCFIWGTGSLALHLLILVLLLPLLGIPHGALDYPLASSFLLERFGLRWSIVFVLSYLVCMAVVIIAWWIFPIQSFGFFLILTWYHFGTGDTIASTTKSKIFNFAEGFSRGGIVLVFSAYFSTQEVLKLFSFLVPEQGAMFLIDMLTALLPFLVITLFISICWSIFNFKHFHSPIELFRACELIMLVILFIYLPALLAFTIYFNFLHSVRHMLWVASGTNQVDKSDGISGMILKTMLVTFATLVLGSIVYLAMGSINFDMSLLTQIVFIGIASMTYPHVLVIAWAERVSALEHPTRLMTNIGIKTVKSTT
jgi:Brp/Blh family beta-carotene 15,15'-monooxygenase